LKTGTLSRTTEADLEEDELPEARSRVQAAAAQQLLIEPEEITRFSSFTRLTRVTAWCLRWQRRVKESRSNIGAPHHTAFLGSLFAMELDEARRSLIRVFQAAHWKRELNFLSKGEAMSKGSLLIKLTPFLDTQGILRVGGRLKHSLLAYDAKHPVILPHGSHLTRLLVENFHRRTLHGGVQLTLGSIRQLYWIPRGRALVKSVLHRCISCVRWRAATPQ